MYENGKAIGGEGHPTNADEITFDNTGTDLVSEEVESAIKEVNAKFDKGSVSVTADGVKTYRTLLDELYALIDSSKTSNKTVLVVGDELYRLDRIASGVYIFQSSRIHSSYVGFFEYRILSTASTYYSAVVTSGEVRVTENSASVATSGTVFEVCY